MAKGGDSLTDIEERKLDLEVARLAQEKDLKKYELDQQKAIKKEEVAIQREQILANRLSIFGWKFSQSAVTIIVSLLAVLGTVSAGIHQTIQNRKLEREKFEYQKEIEDRKAAYQKQANDQKFKSDLTLNAIRTGNPKDASQNLLFLIEAKLLDDPNNSIRAALDKYQPALPVSYGVPVPYTASSRQTFFSKYKAEFGSLPPNGEAVLTELFNDIQQDKNITDVRHVAYILATIKWETGNTFKPTKENGTDSHLETMCGATTNIGRSVGNTQTGDGSRYRGRGYIQLVGRGNYKKVSDALGLTSGDSDLVNYPDKALEPQIAYRVASYLMLKGAVTG